MKLNVSPLVQRYLDGTATASEVAGAIAAERQEIGPKPTGYYEIQDWYGFTTRTQDDLNYLASKGLIDRALVRQIMDKSYEIEETRKLAE